MDKQVQAVKPEVVAWIDEFGNVYPKGARRGPSWVNEHQKGWKEVITLQAHREAMEAQRQNFWQVLELREQAIAKKDAALQACVEAIGHALGCFSAAETEGLLVVLDQSNDLALKGLIERRLMYAPDPLREAGIQAQEAMNE